MEYRVETNKNVVALKLVGRLTFSEHHLCRLMTEDLNKADGSEHLVDLREVEFIDSAGLGVLLLLRENAERNKCKLSLRIPENGQVRRMLDAARFADLMTIVT